MSDRIYLNSHFGFREDTLENWQAVNPLLARGEVSVVRDYVDGNFIKIGDGIHYWNELGYAPFPKGVKGDKGDKGDSGYTLTDADKNEIANRVREEFPIIEQDYNPHSLNAQSGKAVTEAVLYGNTYELIERINITEDLEAVLRSCEPNGNTYRFKKLFIEAIFPPTEGADMLKLYVDGIYHCGIPNVLSPNRRGIIVFTLEYNLLNRVEVTYTNHGSWFSNITDCARTYTDRELSANEAYIRNFCVEVGGQHMPIGTQINVYGVRVIEN